MFLTKLKINPSKRASRELLASPERMHAAVLGCFPPGEHADDSGRTLWRLDQRGKVEFSLLMVSPREPDCGGFVESYGWLPGESTRTASYEPLLDGLKMGQRWRFRLSANPVHAVKDPAHPAARGKRVGHVTAGQQFDWLLARAARNGFSMGTVDEPTALVDSRELLRFKKKPTDKREVTVLRASYSGVLQVTDIDALRHALCHGIGPAKSYGCGLLTLAPLN
ncbi:type I-E CRISPR-associated protein Cas6/Cse3/CasE [Propionibacterium freudenreichii]|uniref:type I-E CRISPR-associated protein Cas6/Cse3/CasE n=1 Tax=Propionibacterium freudenreichii TaxID=1744 RepID=UPI0005434D31|nr:type I-E CRISPR-associated protein Cas6/Cse3/CasE [Propionibacterium freudenreichii]CEG98848.1 CRISPR system CASCADE complex protein CasE [Propionibacterium freudenreichii]